MSHYTNSRGQELAIGGAESILSRLLARHTYYECLALQITHNGSRFSAIAREQIVKFGCFSLQPAIPIFHFLNLDPSLHVSRDLDRVFVPFSLFGKTETHCIQWILHRTGHFA